MAKNFGLSLIALAALAGVALALPAAGVEQAPASADELAQNFAAEHEIGRRFISIPTTCRHQRPRRS